MSHSCVCTEHQALHLDKLRQRASRFGLDKSQLTVTSIWHWSTVIRSMASACSGDGCAAGGGHTVAVGGGLPGRHALQRRRARSGGQCCLREPRPQSVSMLGGLWTPAPTCAPASSCAQWRCGAVHVSWQDRLHGGARWPCCTSAIIYHVTITMRWRRQEMQLALLLHMQNSINRVGGGLSSVALGTVAATSWTTQRLSQSFKYATPGYIHHGFAHAFQALAACLTLVFHCAASTDFGEHSSGTCCMIHPLSMQGVQLPAAAAPRCRQEAQELREPCGPRGLGHGRAGRLGI